MGKKNQDAAIAAVTAAEKFQEFIDAYDDFREAAGLSATIDDIFEVCTSIADKTGRVCRYSKHNRRDDPKPDWEKELGESVAGLVVYSIMAMEHYELDFYEAMQGELLKACEQHGEPIAHG